MMEVSQNKSFVEIVRGSQVDLKDRTWERKEQCLSMSWIKHKLTDEWLSRCAIEPLKAFSSISSVNRRLINIDFSFIASRGKVDTDSLVKDCSLPKLVRFQNEEVVELYLMVIKGKGYGYLNQGDQLIEGYAGQSSIKQSGLGGTSGEERSSSPERSKDSKENKTSGNQNPYDSGKSSASNSLWDDDEARIGIPPKMPKKVKGERDVPLPKAMA
ncbi:hypothetical protein QYF36_021049 [Acer negundo]|nr:hypothetical protein QYF36_021049 [Acer negundo]